MRAFSFQFSQLLLEEPTAKSVEPQQLCMHTCSKCIVIEFVACTTQLKNRSFYPPDRIVVNGQQWEGWEKVMSLKLCNEQLEPGGRPDQIIALHTITFTWSHGHTKTSSGAVFTITVITVPLLSLMTLFLFTSWSMTR